MLTVPSVIGHRGVAAHAPENTLASFALAADLGCAMVEFDARLSADGIPIVFHDDTLERCTTGHGAVGAQTLAALKRLDAGNGQTIPTLAEVLALCLARGLEVNIEIKPDAGTGAATAQAALAVAAACWPASAAAPLISSFDHDALAVAAQHAPQWPRGLLVEHLPTRWRELAERFGCAALHAHHATLTAPAVAAIKAAGLRVLAYTVNDRTQARSLWTRGVDAVFSDVPDRLL